MELYARKRRWKWLLLLAAFMIFGGTFIYTSHLVEKVRTEEQKNLRLWVDAVNRKAQMVSYTESFFRQIKEEERRRVELLAGAYRRLATSEDMADLTFFLDMIEKNKTIPVVLTDSHRNIQGAANVDFDLKKVKRLEGEILEQFSKYPPIPFEYLKGRTHYLYYTDSRLFSELQEVLNDLDRSFIDEVVVNSASVPVLITDSLRSRILAQGNIDSVLLRQYPSVEALTDFLKSENEPIRITLSQYGTCYVFYRDSYLLTQLRYFPFVQLGIIGLFLMVAYFLFSTARRSEQNQVWVGMARETAHQLGTPMSSLMAWMELLKMEEVQHPAIPEIEKDIRRLETITERFSKIGSKPQLENNDVLKIINDSLEYLKTRTSRKVQYLVDNKTGKNSLPIPCNVYLLEWVIENLIKNAVDAMGGIGTFTVVIQEDPKHIILDFTDTGKGIPRSKHKTIFQPGYTSKKRGWGLGLSLARRIVNDYHKGRIFVKNSQPGVGTTIRVILKKD